MSSRTSGGRSTLAAAENPREFFKAMMPEGFRSSKKVDWIISGVPMAFFNPVLRADFAEDASREIERVMAKYRSAGSPMSWVVSPFDRPKDLGDQLLSHGFKLDFHVPVMTIDLGELKAHESPPGLVIREVRDEGDLNEWTTVWADSFKIPKRARGQLKSIFEARTSNDSVISYSGYLGSHVVSTCTLFFGRNAAGIYSVSTAKSARGKGIGTAMTSFALEQARLKGRSLLTLQSSKDGHHIYRKLGFKDRFKIGHYSKTRV